jgi:hypothetical protein
MIARSFAHSSPGCEPMGVILTFWASAGNAASKRANVAQTILISILPKSLILVGRSWCDGRVRRAGSYPGQLMRQMKGRVTFGQE